MIALKAFLGEIPTPLIIRVKGQSKRIIIDVGEIRITKRDVFIEKGEIEKVLECRVKEEGDYLIISPRAAYDYMEKKYGIEVLNNLDPDLIVVLEQWFMSRIDIINTFVKHGRFL